MPRAFSTMTYLGVWVALLALLGATCLAYAFDLGAFNAAASLIIAMAKTALVVLCFMHVRFEKRVTWAWAGVGFYWLGIMAVLTFADYVHRF